MAFVGSLLGAGQGSDYVAPISGNQPIVNPITQAQTDASYQQTQQGLGYQNDFVKALQGQQGIANQSAALNAQQGLQSQLAAQGGAANQSQVFNQQSALAQALSSANAVGNQSQAINDQRALAQQQQGLIGQQQATAGQLQGVANGTGPNPAQAQLAQATGANVANQAALLASQRGASQNVGLMARQIANQGANIQQQAAGQAATLQANQSLNALGALQQQQQAIGNTQAQIGSTNNAAAAIAGQQLAAQQAQQQNQASLASQQIGQQQAQNNAVAGLATQQIAQQQGATNAYNQVAQGEQQNQFGAIGNANSSQAALQGNQNTNNTAIQVQNSKAQQGIFGGLLGGAGSILAKGGMVERQPGQGKNDEPTMPGAKKVGKRPSPDKRMASGGSTSDDTAPMTFSAPPPAFIGSPQGPQSFVGQFMKGGFAPQTQINSPGYQGAMSADNPIQAGGGQLVGKVLSKYVMPGIKSILGYGAPTIDKTGIGSEFNATPEPTLGVEGVSAPTPASGSPSLGVDTNLGGALPEETIDAAAGAAGEAGATAGEAAGGAEAVEGAAAAGEAAEGGEGIESLVALLSRGGETRATMTEGARLKKGGQVKGTAKVPGDSVKNDTVKARLSPEEIVIPRSIVKGPDPVNQAAKFVAAVLAKQTIRKGK